MSLSYGGSEVESGSAGNAEVASLYLQAAVEGVSLFVSSGDEGAAGESDDSDNEVASHGIQVSALATTPYNVAVGGTDYADLYFGATNTYWNSTNTATFVSAKSYIPEIPWNSSCAGQLSSTFEGFATPFGDQGFCNSTAGANFRNIDAGSGGPSACALGDADPATPTLVSGTCAGYPKPAWQSVLGVPSDGVRDVPDVSLFAANGVWGHAYLFCYSDAPRGGRPCSSTFFLGGGTSFSAPIMAGIQALINQNTGTRWGNPNPVYYAVARSLYGAGGNGACNSSLGNAISFDCTFNDVTLGDMAVTCAAGSVNCYAPSGAFGVLSTSNDSYQPAFGTNVGWDFATGIGTVNVSNLVNNWLSGAASAASAAGPPASSSAQ